MTTTTPPGNNSGSGNAYKTKHSFGSNAAFAPSFGLNLNIGNTSQAGGGGMAPAPASGQGHGTQAGGGSHFLLGEPVFNSTEDVRAYCNSVRAAMTQMGIELAIAAKILEARLSQAQTLPGDNIMSSRMRARRVAGKLKKTSDATVAAAKNAVATHAAMLREYQDVMRPRPQHGATTSPFRF